MRCWIIALLFSGAFSLYGAGNGTEPLPKASYLKKPASLNSPAVESYNAAAGVDVRGGIGLFFTGSFIYWQPRQEGMEFGQTDTSLATGQFIGSVVNLDFPYKPGFKAGLGVHATDDNWDLYAEYTWLYMSHKQTTSASESPILSKWYFIDSLFSSMHGNWKCHLDIGDLLLARSCYVGRCLTIRPFFGARGVWIRQRYFQKGSLYAFPTDPQPEMSAKSRCWSIGPRLGLDVNFIIGSGFRFFGKAAGSLLYTRYKVYYRSDDTLSLGTANIIAAKTQNHVSHIRPNAEIGAGFGWGTYFSNYRWYWDLSASYDFQVFWNQNMMYNLAFNNTEPHIGNLTYQGLTATMRFDF